MSRRSGYVQHGEGYGRWQSHLVEEDVYYMNKILKRLRHDGLPVREVAIRIDSNLASEETDLPEPIDVLVCELFPKDNSKIHQTEAYDLVNGSVSSPVLRRGEFFGIAIEFNKLFDMDKDNVKLELSFGPKGATKRGTLIILPVTSAKAFTKESSKWDIRMSRQENTMITLQIQIPHTAAVGLWRMKIISKVTGSDHSKIYDCKESIYILFNPWCKEDPVYLESATDKQEYVLSDDGIIYNGSTKHPTGRPWVFGQFESAVLPASIFVLEKSGLDYASRGNPVKVIRAIASIVNSNDENGVLVGNWSKTYEGGENPSTWTGSAAILEQYLTTGGKPVKYGQCWVFSGLSTTVCRAIGIPCRSITTFASAVDTNDTMTIDYFFDADGNKKRESDSIWNYHVWNECWMTRPDLPAGYGGWQAFDATPQLQSDGMYRSGPASVVAIRRGEISHMYDAQKIFAEVNADVMHWQIDEDSEYGVKKLKTNTAEIGTLIVTKKVGAYPESGNTEMEDVTEMYKPKEGTIEERMSVRNAASKGGLRFYYDVPEPEKEDVHFELKKIEKVMIGKNFKVIVDVENRSDELRTVTSVLIANTVYYTGIISRKVKSDKKISNLEPRQKEELSLEVTVDDYLHKLVDSPMMKIFAIFTVKETRQTWSDEADFQFKMPALTMEIEGQPKLKKRFNLLTYFRNPLQVTLEDCVLVIEGSGLAKSHKISLNDVPPEEGILHVEQLEPTKSGSRKLVAVFWCRQLNEVVASKLVEIEE